MHTIFSYFGSMKRLEAFDHHIRRTWLLISRMYNAEAAKYKSTMSTGFVLLNIDKENGTPSTQLGPKMGINKSSLARMLNKLEEDKLIVRKQDECDKRISKVYLTPFGLESRSIAKQTVLKLNETIAEKLGPKKHEAFLDIMHEIEVILDNEEIFNEHN